MAAFAPGQGYCPPGAVKVVATSAGLVTGAFLSHVDPSDQTITLYDSASGDTGATKIVGWGFPHSNVPHQVHFPSPGLRFNHGLTVDPGNCHVLVIGESR